MVKEPKEKEFDVGDIVQHIQSENMYEIVEEPVACYRLEYNGETYYRYFSKSTSTYWTRCKSEMEDGRYRRV